MLRNNWTALPCRWIGTGLALYGLMTLTQPTLATAQTPVDLELVLAVDASSSVDQAEYGLQMRGIAAALRTPEIAAAISSGPHKQIAINLVMWGEPGRSKAETGWFVLSTAEDIAAFASLVDATPRQIFGGTGIGEAIAFSVDSIRDNAYTGERLTIDVSGDGRESDASFAIRLPEARAMASAAGIVINGLAVLDDEPDLVDYYRAEVAQGADSFVLSANTFEEFADAMRMKLFREIGVPAVSTPALKLPFAVSAIAEPPITRRAHH